MWNCFHCFYSSWLLIHKSAVLLSSQYLTSAMEIFKGKASITLCVRVARILAAISSRQSMLLSLSGAILTLGNKSLENITLVGRDSKKVCCSAVSFLAGISKPMKLVSYDVSFSLILYLSRDGQSINRSSHFKILSSGMGSSQPTMVARRVGTNSKILEFFFLCLPLPPYNVDLSRDMGSIIWPWGTIRPTQCLIFKIRHCSGGRGL